MTDSIEIQLPIIPPENHPYIHDLYRRSGLELDSSAELVMAAVKNRWSREPSNITARAEAAELALGRRVDGQELSELPVLFRLHIFDPEEFDGFLNAVRKVAEFDAGI